jgi:hypothetical protein
METPLVKPHCRTNVFAGGTSRYRETGCTVGGLRAGSGASFEHLFSKATVLLLRSYTKILPGTKANSPLTSGSAAAPDEKKSTVDRDSCIPVVVPSGSG